MQIEYGVRIVVVSGNCKIENGLSCIRLYTKLPCNTHREYYMAARRYKIYLRLLHYVFKVKRNFVCFQKNHVLSTRNLIGQKFE